MAALPPAAQVAGSNQATYESIFKQVDKQGINKIGAVDAASFLKRSGLRETALHKIWELSDPQGRGFLDKQGFFVALKLIALAQNGRDVMTSNLTMQVPVPNLQGSGTHTPPIPSASQDSPWAVTPEEKSKYDAIFEGLNPIEQRLSGDKVKTVFMNSNLPVDVLSRIWDLSDVDKDGLLDKDEFAVAMHLVYRALEKEPTPMTLPPQLMPPAKRKKPPPFPGAVSVLPGPIATQRATPPIPAAGDGSPRGSPLLAPKQDQQQQSTWVVTSQEKSNSDAIFNQIDTNQDGLIGGEEIRPVLLQSGLSQPMLAQIWNLCDTKQTGQLNAEQFALTMYLVNQTKAGVNPPQVLTPDMVPPTLRPKPGSKSTIAGLHDLSSGLNTGEFSALKELDAIGKEIESLSKEKGQLQIDIRTKEEHVKMKMLEIQGLQTELDKSTSQVRQLETQKSEAQRRLDELDEQRTKLEGLLSEVKQHCQHTQQGVDNLKNQISSQETNIKVQEEELGVARVDLNNLRQEEVQLEQQLESGKTQLEMVMESTKGIEQEYQQLQAKLNSLVESKRKLNHIVPALTTPAVTTAVTPAVTPQSNNNQGGVQGIEELGSLDGRLASVDTDVFSTRATAGNSPVSSASGFSVSSETRHADEDFKDDPFKSGDPFANFTESQPADPFQMQDPFKDDPFKSDSFALDPFGADPFKSSKTPDPFQSSSTSDPFENLTTSDPFQSSSTSDPFQGSSTSDPFQTSSNSDPFQTSSSSDPFQSSSTSDPFKTSRTPDPFQTSTTPVPFRSASADIFSSKVTTDLFSDAKADPFKDGDLFAKVTAPEAAAKKDPFTSMPLSSSGPGADDPFKAKDPFSSATTTTTAKTDAFGSIDLFGGGTSKVEDVFMKSSSPSGFGGDPFNPTNDQPALPPKKSKPSVSPSATSTLPSSTAAAASTTGTTNAFAPSDPFASVNSSVDLFGGDPFGPSSAPVAKDGGATDPFADFADFGSVKFDDSLWPPQEGAKQDEDKPSSEEKSQSETVPIHNDNATLSET